MSVSQFTIYRNTDAGAASTPINGLTGSLLALLDAILVNGYTGKTGAGWLKPFPNTSSTGCYQLPAGSCGLYYFLNDAGPSMGAEARLTGFDTITSVFSGVVTGSANQWPTSTQLAIGTGSVVVRKSGVQNSTTRSWIAFADSRSCYMYIQSDTAGTYTAFMMGEFYSYKTTGTDNYRAMVIGRTTESSSTATAEKLDTTALFGTAVAGHFIARSFSGLGPSITCGKGMDYYKSPANTFLSGSVPYPNPTDGATYLARVPVYEVSKLITRGHMRGFWHFCHPPSSLADQATFSGSGSLANRTFIFLYKGGNNSIYCMETSNTVETN